jgi:class 3 adenylate cyclase/AmiR/NasT family two-component response regulator
MSDSDGGSREAEAVMRRLRHDMRTPLGQIIGYSELLEEEVSDRGQDDLVPDLEKIRGAAKTLLLLVDEYFSGEPVARTAASVPQPKAGAAAEAAEGEPPSGSGGSILVVDDEANNRDILTRKLTARGFAVDVAEDGESALSKVWSGSYDLVILDIMMPGISGIEVLEAIRKDRSATELPVIMATALDTSEMTADALRRGANDYVTKPIDLTALLARMENQLLLARATRQLATFAHQLELRNAFIRKTFGRYVSDEVASDVLESPDGLEIRGEKRRVTIMLTDIRGFTALTESLSPVEVVAILNNYLGKMAEIISHQRGTIDEFIGDAILALFGAPTTRDDDAERAVACALQMQCAMAEVNVENRRQGLPDVEMGIGIATGDVIVGNIGSEHRTKYAAVGTPINLAARVESYTLGGEILIDQNTFDAVARIAVVDSEREVHPKGMERPITIRQLVGLSGEWNLELPAEAHELEELADPIAVEFTVLDGKQVGADRHIGSVRALSPTAAVLYSDVEVEDLASIRLEVPGGPAGACYAKVVSTSSQEQSFVIGFTSGAAVLTAVRPQPR